MSLWYYSTGWIQGSGGQVSESQGDSCRSDTQPSLLSYVGSDISLEDVEEAICEAA